MGARDRQLTTSQQFTADQLTLIRSVVARDTTPEQFRFFIEVCNHYQLNPIARQIYAVVRKGQLTIQTSIDGFRLMAERTGKYAGQTRPEWCADDGVWVDVWLRSEPPAAARVAVIRRDFEQPIWGIARYASYVQQSNPIWLKMSDVMLAKCAESLAFRKAFPAEMSGIYTHEEMTQADHLDAAGAVTVTPVEADRQESDPALLDKQVVRAKKRAQALGLASNTEEWQAILAYCGVEQVTGATDIEIINLYLDEVEQERQQTS